LPDADPNGPRIVSLAPNLTEFVAAVGAAPSLVGRSSACDYPPDAVAGVAAVGGFGRPNLEALLRVRPTLVLTADLEDESVAGLLARRGIRHERIACARLEDLPDTALRIGALAGAEPEGRRLAESLRRGLAALRAQPAPNPAPTVFIELWSDPLMTAGRGAFVADLVRLAGGRNLGDEASARDYFPVSGEWVLARDPDVILCLSMASGAGSGQPSPGAGRSEAARARLAARPGWSGLRAVQGGRVYGGFDHDLILRAGPRVLEGARVLAACIRDGKAASP